MERCARRLAVLIAAGLLALPALAQKVGGAFSVDDSGQPTYGYPISVPPGIAGMDPKLSLYYGGSSFNGPVGVGWSIQGFSEITRCGAIPAIDSKRSAPTYVPADKLCMDGNRLIQVDSTGTPLPLASQVNDAEGLASGAYTEYRTEKDQYARIRAYGTAPGTTPPCTNAGSASNGPAYFLVWTKSGQIYEYGNTTDSQITPQGKCAVMVWAVDKVSDTLGNYIAFKYTVSQNTAWGTGTSTANPRPGTEWNLAEVWYTGTATQAPTNKVVFTYGARTDGGEAYHAGSKNVNTQLLKTISTYVNAPATIGATGIGVKQLQLTYGPSGWSGRSRLTKIAECSLQTAGKCLPPTQFGYHDSTTNSSCTPTPGISNPPDCYTVNPNYNMNGVQMMDQAGKYGILLGDFNGDGKTDILRWSDTPANNQLWLSNGDGSFTQVPAATFGLTSTNIFRSDDCYHSIVADFNGDGVADILTYGGSSSIYGVSCPAAQSVLYLGDPKGSGAFTAVPVSVPLNRAPLNLTSACTKTDPGSNPPVCRLWSFTWGSYCLSSCSGSAATFYVLDVNGDGILDLIISTIPAGSIRNSPTSYPVATPCATVVCTQVFLGSAPSPGKFTFTSVPTNLANVDTYTVPPAYFPRPFPTNLDLNGDGYADLLEVGSFLGTSVGTYLSNGDGNFSLMQSFSRLAGRALERL